MIIRRIGLTLPAVLLGWIAVMALVMRFSDAAPAAVVVMPSKHFMSDLPDAAVLARGRFTITLISDASGFAKKLYNAGAWLVLPAGLTGCLPLPRTATSGA